MTSAASEYWNPCGILPHPTGRPAANLGTGHGLENVNEHELHNLTHYTRSHAICRSGKLNIAAIMTEWHEYTFIHTENVKLFWCERRKGQSSIVIYACMSTEKKPVILSSLFYYNTASYIQDKEKQDAIYK